MTAALVADRTNAQHAAQAAPMADPSSPSASPVYLVSGRRPGARHRLRQPTSPAPAPKVPSGPAVARPRAPRRAACECLDAGGDRAAGPPPAPAPRKAVQSAALGAASARRHRLRPRRRCRVRHLPAPSTPIAAAPLAPPAATQAATPERAAAVAADRAAAASRCRRLTVRRPALSAPPPMPPGCRCKPPQSCSPKAPPRLSHRPRTR